jgi:hypothetical protein
MYGTSENSKMMHNAGGQINEIEKSNSSHMQALKAR